MLLKCATLYTILLLCHFYKKKFVLTLYLPGLSTNVLSPGKYKSTNQCLILRKGKPAQVRLLLILSQKKRRGLSSPSVVAGYHYDLIKNMITMGRAIEIISQSIIRAERMGPCKLAIFSSEFLANLNSLSNQLINP